MEVFNPFDLDKWRALLRDFDAKRVAFADNLNGLRLVKGETPALEKERQELLAAAGPIEKNIARLMQSAQTVRDWLSTIGSSFGLGGASQTMSGLGFAPIFLVVGLGAAAIIVKSITDWLTKTAAFKARNDRVALLVDAGATPAEIIQAEKGAKSQLEIFGLKSGGLKWVFAIGALILLGPPIYRQIEKRL